MARPIYLNFTMYIISARLTLKVRAVTNMMYIINVKTISLDICLYMNIYKEIKPVFFSFHESQPTTPAHI